MVFFCIYIYIITLNRITMLILRKDLYSFGLFISVFSVFFPHSFGSFVRDVSQPHNLHSKCYFHFSYRPLLSFCFSSLYLIFRLFVLRKPRRSPSPTLIIHFSYARSLAKISISTYKSIWFAYSQMHQFHTRIKANYVFAVSLWQFRKLCANI